MDYRKQLVPLYHALVRAGRMPRPAPSKKRADLEAAVLRVLGRYDPNRDPAMLRARAEACEAELARVQTVNATPARPDITRRTL